MSLLKILGTEYEPTAAFSFEFFLRKQNARVGELFFLLPPEEYSMTEGYKVTVTKTAGGGWIDDFGNDFKQLRLSGSLYSYYSGYPTTINNVNSSLESGIIGGAKKFAKNIGNKVVEQGKRFTEGAANIFGVSIPGLKGMSGLEEFFKLRYIVSRFRDDFKSIPKGISQEDYDKIISATEGKSLYDKIGIIFHDYDDNNHYEIVFTNFTMNRSKDDPFTIKYTIEMTCLKEDTHDFLGIGKVVQRENPFAIIKDFQTTYSEVLDALSALNNIPNQILNNYNALITLGEDLENEINRFVRNIASNWRELVSRINDVQSANDDFEKLIFTSTTGKPITDLEDETEELPEEYLNIQKELERQKESLAHLKGTEKYYSLEEQEKIYNLEEKVLETSDFNADAEEKQDNVYTSKNKVYYIVKQGDTLSRLAYTFYGDHKKSSIIGDANDLKNSDFENDGMIGKNIVIPLEFKSPEKSLDNNLVYFKKLKQATAKERQLQVLGNDFELNSNREILADGTGDIAMVYGEDCYIENIHDRIRFPEGTLSPIHPEWGIILDVGKAPASIALRKTLNNIEKQALSDPRTKKAIVDETESSFEADSLKVLLRTTPYSGQEGLIDAKDVVAGLLV